LTYATISRRHLHSPGFSTKERRPFLREAALRESLHAYLGGISKQLECAPIIVGGVEDHVHLLARFSRTIAQAEWVKELKRVSNLWLKERGKEFRDFEWQRGYAGFSVSQSEPGAGEEIHRRAGRASPEDDLPGRGASTTSQTRIGMG